MLLWSLCTKIKILCITNPVSCTLDPAKITSLLYNPNTGKFWHSFKWVRVMFTSFSSLSAAYQFLSRACERSVSGAENGAERPENQVERSGAVSACGRKTVKRSGARRGRSRSGNGAWSGLNWPLTARSNVIFY